MTQRALLLLVVLLFGAIDLFLRVECRNVAHPQTSPLNEGQSPGVKLSPTMLWYHSGNNTSSDAGNLVLFDVATDIIVSVVTDGNHSLRGYKASDGGLLWSVDVEGTCSGNIVLQSLQSPFVNVSNGFMFACNNYFDIRLLTYGTLLKREVLPLNAFMTTLSQPTAGGNFLISTALVPNTDVVVLSVTTHGSNVSRGTLGYAVNIGSFFGASEHNGQVAALFECLDGTFVQSWSLVPFGYLQFCSAQRVMYLRVIQIAQTTKAIGVQWNFINTSILNFFTGSPDSPSNATIVSAVAQIAPDNSIVIGFDITSLESLHAAAWTYCLTYAPLAVQIATGSGANDVVIIVTDSTRLVISLATGTLLWQVPYQYNLNAPLVIQDTSQPLVFGVLSQNLLLMIDIATGATLGSTAIDYPIDAMACVGFAYVFASISRLVAPYGRPNVVESMLLRSRALVLAVGPVVVIVDFTTGHGTLFGAWNVDATSCSFVSSNEASLILATSAGFGLLSLSFGWKLSNLLSATQVADISYCIASDGGTLDAVDRNGDFSWNVTLQMGPLSSPSVTFAPLVSLANGVLIVVQPDDGSIAVVDAISGASLQSLYIPSDCYSNQSIAVPHITGLAIDEVNQIVYFGAGLQCLFLVKADLSLDCLVVPFVVATTPVIDSDNQLILVRTLSQVHSISVPLGLTTRTLWKSHTSLIARVVPSSWSPDTLHKGSNPLVFVFTQTEIIAIDVLAMEPLGTFVWKVAITGTFVNSIYYNSSFYVLSTEEVCRVVTDPSATTRLPWCVPVPANSMGATNLEVTKDGVVVFIVGGTLFAFDASSGGARWAPEGSLPLKNVEACGSISYDGSQDMLFALCSSAAVLLDTSSNGTELLSSLVDNCNFSANSWTNFVDPVFFSFCRSFDGPGVLYATPISTSIRNRTRVEPPSASTILPTPLTYVPETVPTPQPQSTFAPVSPAPAVPYPPNSNRYYPTTPMAAIMDAQTFFNFDVSPDIAFLSPTQPPAQWGVPGTCVVAAFNISSFSGGFQSPLWITNVPWLSNCACGAPVIGAVGGGSLHSDSATFSFLCGGTLYAYSARTGTMLWNTTIAPFAVYDAQNIVIQSNFTNGQQIVTLTSALSHAQMINMFLLAFSLSTGALVLQIELAIAVGNTMTEIVETVDQQHTLVVVTGTGLDVILINDTNISLSTHYIQVMGGLPGSHSGAGSPDTLVVTDICVAGQGILAATEPYGDGFTQRSTFYRRGDVLVFGCPSLTAWRGALFTINVNPARRLDNASVINVFGNFSLTTCGSYDGVSSLVGVKAIPVNQTTTNFVVTAGMAITVVSSTGNETHCWVDCPNWNSILTSSVTLIDHTLLIAGNNNQLLYAYNWSSMQPLWTATLLGSDSNVIDVNYQPLIAIPYPELSSAGNQQVLVGFYGVYLIDVVTGQLTWRSKYASVYVSWLSLTVTDLYRPEGDAARGDPVYAVTAIISASQSLGSFVAVVPGGAKGWHLKEIDAQIADVAANPRNPTQKTIVAESSSGVITNFGNWSTDANNNPWQIYVRYLSGRPVAFALSTTTISVYDLVSGAFLGTLYFEDVCPLFSSFGTTNNYFAATDQLAFIVDSQCVYAFDIDFNAGTATLSGTVLTSTSSIFIGGAHPLTFSTPNVNNVTELLYAADLDGTVIAVNASTLNVVWRAKLAQYLGPQNGVVQIPPYGWPNNEATPPLATQQLLVWSTQGIVSLCAATGEFLWFWQDPAENEVTGLTTTSDGFAVYITSAAMVKISLAVSVDSSIDRVVWSVAIPFANSDNPFVAQPRQANVLVYSQSYSSVCAVDVTSGSPLWCNGALASTVYIDRNKFCVSRNASDSLAPCDFIVVDSSDQVFTVLSIATGDVVLTMDNGGNMRCAESQFYFMEQGTGLFVVPILLPSAPQHVKPSVIASPPLVPFGFHGTLPPPQMASVNATATLGAEPLFAWRKSIVSNFQSGMQQLASVVATLSNGTAAMFSFGRNGDEGAAVVVTNLYSGLPLTDFISMQDHNALWLVQMSVDIGLIICKESLIWFDLRNIPNRSSLHILKVVSFQKDANTLTRLVESLDQVSPVPLELPEVGQSCLQPSRSTPFSALYCFSTSPTNLKQFGMLTYRVNCSHPFPSAPTTSFTYNADVGLVFLTCSSGTSGTAVLAFNATSGLNSWTRTVADGIVQFVDFDGVSVGAYMYHANSSTTVVALIDLASGTLLNNILQNFPADDLVSDFLVVGGKQLVFTFKFRIAAFVVSGNGSTTTLWSVPSLTPISASELSHLSKQHALAFYSNADGIYSLDVSSGVSLLVASSMSTSTAHEMRVVNNGTIIALLGDTSVSLVSVDGLGSAALTSFTPEGPLLLNMPSFRMDHVTRTPIAAITTSFGNTSVFFWNSSQLLPLADFELMKIGDQSLFLGSSSSANESNSSYLMFNASTGQLMWGWEFGSVSPLFDAITLNTTAFGPLVLQSFQEQFVNAFDAFSGSFVFSIELPSCPQPQELSGAGTAAIADPLNKVMYIVTGESCLYAVDIEDASSFFITTPQQTLLNSQVLLLTDHCIIVLDSYNTLLCIRRGSAAALGAPSAKYLVWSFEVGYGSGSSQEVRYYENILVFAVGDAVYCLDELTGETIFALANLGHRFAFTFFGNETMFLQSDKGIYRISLNPLAAESQRTVWSVPLTSNNGIPLVAPFVAVDGNVILVVGGNRIVCLNGTTGVQVWQRWSPGAVSCSSLAYSPASLPNVFAVTCEDVSLISVADGSKIAVISANSNTNLLLLESSLVFVNANGNVQIDHINGDVVRFAPSVSSVAVAPMSPIAIPVNFTPQDPFTPLPTLPSGAPPLPDLSCVLNIEALYPTLVSCVNDAIVATYASVGNFDNAPVNCSQAAALLNHCTMSWLANTSENCNSSYVYLNEVLGALNHSSAFQMCGNESHCADGIIGSSAVCSALNAAQPFAGSSTFSPLLKLPKPANEIPQFTIPGHTASPPSTTSSPTVAPSMAPVIQQEWMFTCVLPTGATSIPGAFKSMVAAQIGGTESTVNVSFGDLTRLASGRLEFTFWFTSAAAMQQSNDLRNQVVGNAAAVAQSLNLRSIEVEPFEPMTPPPTAPAPKKPLTKAGIIGVAAGSGVTLLVVVFLVARRIAKSRRRRYKEHVESYVVIAPNFDGTMNQQSAESPSRPESMRLIQ